MKQRTHFRIICLKNRVPSQSSNRSLNYTNLIVSEADRMAHSRLQPTRPNIQYLSSLLQHHKKSNKKKSQNPDFQSIIQKQSEFGQNKQDTKEVLPGKMRMTIEKYYEGKMNSEEKSTIKNLVGEYFTLNKPKSKVSKKLRSTIKEVFSTGKDYMNPNRKGTVAGQTKLQILKDFDYFTNKAEQKYLDKKNSETEEWIRMREDQKVRALAVIKNSCEQSHKQQSSPIKTQSFYHSPASPKRQRSDFSPLPKQKAKVNPESLTKSIQILESKLFKVPVKEEENENFEWKRKGGNSFVMNYDA